VNNEEISEYSNLIDKLLKEGKGDPQDLKHIKSILTRDSDLEEAYKNYLKSLDAEKKSRNNSDITDQKKIDLEVWGHRFLFERLNKYLNLQNEILAEIGNPHEYGIMIMDSEGYKKDQKLRNKLTGMLFEGTHYSELDYLIEDPLFTDSKWRNLSQVVDCLAYCIRKKYRTNTPSLHTTKWLEYFSMIEKKFHKKNGFYLRYGLKIFP